jgi:hypothetical protein
MPIRKYTSGASFDPETIAVMVTAFENSRTILNLDNPNDPMVEIVAKKIISLASQGIRDSEEIGRRVAADTLLSESRTRL